MKRIFATSLLAILMITAVKAQIEDPVSWSFSVEPSGELEAELIFKATIPSERMLEMRYEDLCTKPREEGARLCAFLNLPMTDEAADYLATGIRSDKVAQYLERRPEHIAEVEARVGDLLSELGYR